MGFTALNMLPKKLRGELRWDSSVNDAFNLPVGWGFYIAEGFDWLCITWSVVVASLAVTILTIYWSVLMHDVQGGTGIGQYCIGVLAFLVSAVVLANGPSRSDLK